MATVINDKVISLGGGENRIDLTSAFTDADSDHLTFTASSSDTGIATVSIIGALMVINPLSMGMTTITVMADDNKGGTISQTFNVKVDKMVIFEQSEGIPLTRNQSTTQDLKLTVNIFENAQVNKIRLEFTNVTLDISKFDPMFKMFGHYYSFFIDSGLYYNTPIIELDYTNLTLNKGTYTISIPNGIISTLNRPSGMIKLFINNNLVETGEFEMID